MLGHPTPPQGRSLPFAGPAPCRPRPAPVNLFLVAGWWQAACPTCGHVLVEGRRLARVEREAARTACPVCVEVA
jgi:hypothetical protein